MNQKRKENPLLSAKKKLLHKAVTFAVQLNKKHNTKYYTTSYFDKNGELIPQIRSALFSPSFGITAFKQLI